MANKVQTGLISDTVITLPADDVTASGGFSLDIGSSVAKIIYRSNKEYKNGVPLGKIDDHKKGTLHYALFPRNDLDGVIQYIKENCDFKRGEDGIVQVYASGVGGSTFKKNLEEELSAKLSIKHEMDCFATGFIALTSFLSKEDFLHPPPAKAVAAAAAHQAQMEDFMKKAEEAGDTFNMGLDATNGKGKGKEKEKEEEEGIGNPHLPCLIAMCGSGTGFTLLDKHGTPYVLEGPVTAGRFFYGLATYLGKTNDFDKLMEMAKRGDGRSVDTYIADLTHEAEEGEEKNLYNAAAIDMLIFPFGKVVTSKEEDIKRDDLVFSAYNCVAATHMQFAYVNALHANVKNVYFCGNLFNNELGRELILERKGLRDAFTPPASSFLKLSI